MSIQSPNESGLNAYVDSGLQARGVADAGGDHASVWKYNTSNVFQWSWDHGGDSVAVCADASYVYVTNGTRIWKLDASDASEEWSYQHNSAIRSLCVDGSGNVYFGSVAIAVNDYDVLFKLNSSGVKQWGWNDYPYQLYGWPMPPTSMFITEVSGTTWDTDGVIIGGTAVDAEYYGGFLDRGYVLFKIDASGSTMFEGEGSISGGQYNPNDVFGRKVAASGGLYYCTPGTRFDGYYASTTEHDAAGDWRYTGALHHSLGVFRASDVVIPSNLFACGPNQSAYDYDTEGYEYANLVEHTVPWTGDKTDSFVDLYSVQYDGDRLSFASMVNVGAALFLGATDAYGEPNLVQTNLSGTIQWCAVCAPVYDVCANGTSVYYAGKRSVLTTPTVLYP